MTETTTAPASEKIELFNQHPGNKPAAISLGDFLSKAIAEAKAPEHYIKTRLDHKTAPGLFVDRNAEGKLCTAITLDDGGTILTDLCFINRQDVTIFAANCDSRPHHLNIPLKKRVW